MLHLRLLPVQREREVSLALSVAGAACGTSGSFGMAGAAQTFEAAPSGVPSFYETDVFSHPSTGKRHAYIMLQLLGRSLHELVDDGEITLQNFLPVRLRNCTAILSPNSVGLIELQPGK